MTTEFLVYLAKVALSILLLMGLFKVALAADQSFARNRFYLMGAILWSILVPLLTLPQDQAVVNMLPAVAISPTYTISLPELMVTPQGASHADSPWGDPRAIVLTIYLTGVVIFLLRMMAAYTRVLYIIATSKDYTIDSYNIKVTRAGTAPFAFFGWIVFPEKLINHRDLTKMLIHERVHSRQLHSFDLLLGELFAVFQWFNPASWMLKKLITENHEYTADRAVIDLGVSTYEYQASLVNATVGREVIPASHFSLILIKKRIKMMNKNRNSAWLRVKSLLVPVAFVAALTLTSFTVEESVSNIAQVMPDVTTKKEISISSLIQNEPSKTEQQDTLRTTTTILNSSIASCFSEKDINSFRKYLAQKTIYPEIAAKNKKVGTVYVKFTIEENGSISNVRVDKPLDVNLDREAIRVVSQSPSFPPLKQNGQPVKYDAILPFKFLLIDIKDAIIGIGNGSDENVESAPNCFSPVTVFSYLNEKKEELSNKIDQQDDGDKIYMTVEQMPFFGNNKETSMQEMMEFLAKNINYPTEAAKNAVQGTVFIQFIVEKDGSVNDVKAFRGVDPLIDKEAIRVTKSMPKWTPGMHNGKIVRVAFMMPVKFMLM